MGVYQELLDFDDIYHRRTKFTPVVLDTEELLQNKKLPKSHRRMLVVNKMSGTTEREREFINSAIFTRYNNDSSISNIPSCDCGKLNRRHLKNVICDACGEPCINRYETDIQSVLWFRAPKGIRALINPHMLTMLSERFRVRSFDTIRWLTDTGYSSTIAKPKQIIALEEALANMNFQRGFNNFYDRFDELMEMMFDRPSLRPQNMAYDHLRDLIRMERGKVFCQTLPLPNKLISVVEETNFFTYHNKDVQPAMEALWLMAGIDSDLGWKGMQRENRTAKANWLLAEYSYRSYSRTYMRKEGIFRGQTYGYRSIFSFRTVISSITDPHDYFKIEIPWGVGVTIFRYHLINKLDARGWQAKDIINLLNEHALKYHPLLDELFQELIRETPKGRGFATAGVRNPSLKRGSAQLLYIGKVKTAVEDVTTGIAGMIVKPYNADFDGDMMAFALLLDNKMTRLMSTLEPHFSALNFDEPFTISSDLAIFKPAIATIANRFHHGSAPDPIKRERMQQLLVTH